MVSAAGNESKRDIRPATWAIQTPLFQPQPRTRREGGATVIAELVCTASVLGFANNEASYAVLVSLSLSLSNDSISLRLEDGWSKTDESKATVGA